MLLILIAIMGLKALFFGFGNEEKQQEKKKAQLVECNNKLNELYALLATIQDTFAEKRGEYEKDVAAINSKKSEIDNRVEYMDSIKRGIAEKVSEPFTDLKDFKDCCANYVSAFTSLEEAQTELHSLEVELQVEHSDWEQENRDYNARAEQIRSDIQSILSRITKLQGKK